MAFDLHSGGQRRRFHVEDTGTVVVAAGGEAHASFTLPCRTPVTVSFVTYSANGGAGNVPIDPTAYLPGSTVTVLGNTGNLTKAGYDFGGWTDGSATYAAGQAFVIGDADVALSAVWIPVPPQSWIVGFWGPRIYAPHSSVIDITAYGTYSMYDNYDGSGAVLATGTVSLVGDKLFIDDAEVSYSKVSDDEFSILQGGLTHTMCRRGSAVTTNVFLQNETTLSTGAWAQGTIAKEEMQLYSYTAPAGGGSMVWWQGFAEAPDLTADIAVSAYRADRATPFFVNEMNKQYPPPQPVSLAAGEKVYLIVECPYKRSGTYRIMVGQASGPAFAGTWAGMFCPAPDMTVTVTWTLTETSLVSQIDFSDGGAITERSSVWGVDEALRHFITRIDSIETTGGKVSTNNIGDVNYWLYYLSGSTITVESSPDFVSVFPTELTGNALILARMP